MEFRKGRTLALHSPLLPLTLNPKQPHIYSICCPLTLPNQWTHPAPLTPDLLHCCSFHTLTNAYSSPAALHSNCSGWFQQTYCSGPIWLLANTGTTPSTWNEWATTPILHRTQAARPNCTLSHSYIIHSYIINVNSDLPAIQKVS